jgi:hypothetical protein
MVLTHQTRNQRENSNRNGGVHFKFQCSRYWCRLTTCGVLLSFKVHNTLSSSRLLVCVVPCLRWLDFDLSLRWAGFSSRPVGVGILVYKLALSQVLLPVLWFTVSLSCYQYSILIDSCISDGMQSWQLIGLSNNVVKGNS